MKVWLDQEDERAARLEYAHYENLMRLLNSSVKLKGISA